MKEPVRSCIVCRKVAPKKKLLRLAIAEKTRVVVDPETSMQGRGAYIHLDLKCGVSAIDKKKLGRAFRLASEELDCSTLFLELKKLGFADPETHEVKRKIKFM